ncbi:MAG: hypothetical protein JW884_05840 [Deltaproteobacteria bacterium]|nr:hypothetical protein [Deltaproteobacteria bacterium]
MKFRLGALTVLLICVVAALAGPAMAAQTDEIAATISEALDHYNKGEFSAAVSSLDYASELVRQKAGTELQKFLPEPLSGWTADEATSQSVSTAMLGGGIYAERVYRKNGSSVTVKIITESPLMQGIMMMMTNPGIVTASGGRLEKIKGQRAVVNYNDQAKDGTINLIVANRVLVTIEGSSLSKKELTSYAEAIDYRKIGAL